MTKTQQSPTQNAATIAGVLIVLSFVGIYFFLMPGLVAQRTTLASDKAQLEGLEKNKQSLQNAQKQLNAAMDELTAKGVNFNKLSSVYPPNEDMPGLYVQLESLMSKAATYNVKATYQASAPVADAAGGGKIPLTFTATGALSDLETFITSLETNTRPILLSSVSVTAPTTETNGLLTLTASGLTHVAQISSAYSTTNN